MDPAPAGADADADAPEAPAVGRLLGHAVALGLLALFVMVALGVFWVWQRSSREQRWRDRINAAESFTAPAPAR
jgi:hypothetical protein